MFEKATYKEQAYNYLLDLILKNGLEEGKVYSERYFAEKMGISRTPVREAILHLAQEGYITIQSNRGIQVKELSKEEIKDILQMREAIEGFCAEYAAERKEENKELVCVLKKYIDEEEKNISHEEFIKNDIEFHTAIVDFCKNRIMKEAFINLRNQINRIGLKSFDNKERIQETLREHKEIVKAVESGDTALAKAAVKRHLESCLEVMTE